ncbi:MFS general substrate transporter [Gonapodya prolifera JEL478]|uniref:MFS general substrate transporter n=1 Tax=Gonapodya prolifera (strain JEL478) TaxID=1344416 RepID=A0A139AU25_GONPJ|nr:MFS general substrate transporter [Gonapodya prolifera JEL478]|eukprot:KXS20207.1 MFS general substrate transporter [Gonapodya prolifera JEL478]
MTPQPPTGTTGSSSVAFAAGPEHEEAQEPPLAKEPSAPPWARWTRKWTGSRRERDLAMPRAVWFLLNCLAGTHVPFLSLYYKDQLGVKPRDIGKVNAAAPFIAVVSSSFWALLATRTGRPKAVLLSTWMVAVAATLMTGSEFVRARPQDERWWYLAMFTVVNSSFNAGFIPILEAWLLSYLHPYAHLAGPVRAFGPLGFSLASVSVGWLMGKLGPDTMWWAYGVTAAALLVAIVLSDWSALERAGQPQRSVHNGSANGSGAHGRPETLRDSEKSERLWDIVARQELIWYIAATLPLHFSRQLSLSLHPLSLRYHFLASPGLTSLAGPLRDAGNVALSMMSGSLLDSVGPRGLLVLAAVLQLCRSAIVLVAAIAVPNLPDRGTSPATPWLARAAAALGSAPGALWARHVRDRAARWAPYIAILAEPAQGASVAAAAAGATGVIGCMVPACRRTAVNGFMHSINFGLSLGLAHLLGGHIYSEMGATAMYAVGTGFAGVAVGTTLRFWSMQEEEERGAPEGRNVGEEKGTDADVPPEGKKDL